MTSLANPLSSCVATAAGSSPVTPMPSYDTTVAKPVSSPSTVPFPFPVSPPIFNFSFLISVDLLIFYLIYSYFCSIIELMAKLGEMCGTSVILRCQLPTEDLDALVSITSDEDLANLIEEYDHASAPAAAAEAEAALPPSPSSLKIRAFLSAPKTPKKSSSPPSSASCSSNESSSPKSPFCTSAVSGVPPRHPTPSSSRNPSRPPIYPISADKSAGKIPQKYAYQCQYHHHHHHQGHGNGGRVFVIHNGNHWQ